MNKLKQLTLIGGLLALGLFILVVIIVQSQSSQPLSNLSIQASTYEASELPAETGISLEGASDIMPLSPTEVSAVVKNGKIVVKWHGTGEDVNYYEILRRISASDAWVQVAEVQGLEENTGWYEWEESNLSSDVSNIYGVRAVNTYGTQSIISESLVVISP